jgi:tetratricopeptide (TPR) repeat protein
MDVALVDHGESIRLLRNDVPHGNWIEFRLHSRVPESNAPLGFGDGATVIAWAGGVPLRRAVGSSSYLSQDSHRVHIGLGRPTQIERLEVHWLNGRSEIWTDLTANRIWDITEGEPMPRLFLHRRPPTREEEVRFWAKQRAAMDAMKRDRDIAKAVGLFREALVINPNHEDSRYYLANCLAGQGDIAAAVAELEMLAHLNPLSHRAFQRKGELLASSALTRAELTSARPPLLEALRLNSEETGALVLLGEVDLALGDLNSAGQRLARACQANARASDAWFLRGYIAWKQHDSGQAAEMLWAARKARGPDWKPSGAAFEGDVRRRMHERSAFLSLFAEAWDGTASLERAYNGMDQYLRQLR